MSSAGGWSSGWSGGLVGVTPCPVSRDKDPQYFIFIINKSNLEPPFVRWVHRRSCAVRAGVRTGVRTVANQLRDAPVSRLAARPSLFLSLTLWPSLLLSLSRPRSLCAARVHGTVCAVHKPRCTMHTLCLKITDPRQRTSQLPAAVRPLLSLSMSLSV